MARDVTVTFDDGSQHVYRGAPDDITPQQVQERAEREFKRPVTALDGGRKPAPEPEPIVAPPTPQPQPEGAPLLERALGKSVGKTADTMLGGIVDVPLQVASGVAGGVEMISNFFGADNKLSSAMRDTQGYLSGLLSASAKQDQKEIARILEDAKDKGVLDQVKAGLKAFTVAPVDMMSQAFGTMAPVVATGAATALAQIPAIAAGAITTGVGAVMGAGTVKGSIYQATQDILKERTDLSEKQINKIAEQAQAYGGKNLDQILIGSGLGAFGARTGIESAFAKNLAKGITSKAATLEAIEAAGKKETEAMAKAGVKKTAAKKGAAEFAGESLEGGQEQLAANIAQQREGFADVPTMRGVVSQATMEGMAGLGLGAYGGAREAYRAKQGVATPLTEEEKAFLEPSDVKRREEALQKTGTLSPELEAAIQSATVATKEQLTPAKEGAPSDTGTVKPAAGTSATVAAQPETTAAGAPGPDVGGVDTAGAAVATTDAGKEAESTALKQQKLEALSTRRNELVDMIDEGLPEKHAKVKNKLKALNNLEQELGLKLSTYDQVSFDTEPPGGAVLSAKKQAPKYVSIADLKEQLKTEGKEVPDNLTVVAASTHPSYKIDPNATAEENLQGAMDLAASQEQSDEAERQQLLEASKKKGEIRYDKDNIPESAEELYNDTREEKPDLPQWYKLDSDEKDVYFSYIRRNSLEEHAAAADALIAYRKEKGSRAAGYGQEATTPAAQRTINNYEENRDIASKLLGIEMPRWGDLSKAAQKAYTDQIRNNAGLQMDVAFAAAAEQMVREKQGITEQQRQATIDNINRRQDKVRLESEKNQAELEKLRRDYERAAGTEAFVPGKEATKLSKSVIEHLMKGRLNMALEEIAKKLSKNPDPQTKMAAQIAKRLADLGLKTKVRISTEPLPDNDLAQYDPVKDEIVIGPDGFSTSTLLHEVTHAGTVRVMYLYMSGKKNLLSERQIKGVEQILKIMRATQQELSKDPAFENAYDNPYEFIAYALNDKQFQAALQEAGYAYFEAAEMEQGLKESGILDEDTKFGLEPIESLLPDKKNAWSAFKKAIAGIINFAKTPFKNLNFVMELNAAFDDILSVPEGPINIDQTLAAKGKKAKPKKEPLKAPEYTAPGFINSDARYKTPEAALPPNRWKKMKDSLTTAEGWRKIARAIQDRRAYAKYTQRKIALAGGRIIRDLSKNFNNFYDQLVVSAAEAENFYNGRLQAPMDNLRMSVREFASSMNLSIKEATEMLHPIVEAFHEPERRFVKWMLTVPLSKAKTLMHNGKLISPAERREQIVGDKAKGIKGIIHQAALNDQQKAALRQELEFLTGGKLVKGPEGMFTFQKKGGFTDPKGGYTPVTDRKITTDDFYDKGGVYNVLGIGEQQVNKVKEELNTLTAEQRAALTKVMENASEVSKQAAKLEQIGGYWSWPVSNMTGIYDWQYYMPFKGKNNQDLDNSDIGRFMVPDSKRNGRELQEIPYSMDGRFSASNNPITQLMSDATRAAGRAGRRNVTQAIKNALPFNKETNPEGTGIIDGKVEKHIPFEDRETEDLAKYKTDKYIFHYNDDGSVDILYVADSKLRESIRLSFQKTNMLLDTANRVTGFFGRMHTRYNFDFPFLNFVRDMLTNAWTIGAEFGPMKSAQFIKEVATQVVVHRGLYKAFKVAALHDKGDAASIRELKALEEKDPYVKDMLDYLRQGGKTTYLSGFALRTQLEELDKGLDKSRIVTKAEDVGRLLDIWVNMFEFASRTAAYSLMRDEFQQRNIAKGMDKARAREEATVEAVAYAKELANFEQVGEYGRALGALYMFIRPSATGAARAIEAVVPAFRDMPGTKWAFGTTKDVADTLPEGIRNDPEAMKAFMENYRQQQKNARAMISILIGAGAAMFLLSAAGAADDDEGRNATLNDNMEQWTRYARFHIPNSVSEAMGLGKDVVFQMPWGFGLGSFMSIGAQLVAMGVGNTSMKEGFANITSALLDSYVPIPFSKMPISEMPLAWAIDSAMPTVVRPAVEFIMNKNGIGQDINSASTRRMADAFTGGDRIPELYRDLAVTLFEASNGETDITPNTLYFFANSYLDGVGRIAQMMYNSGTKTEREFNPRTDLPTLTSFFGAKSNVDAREFGKMETKIKEIDKRLATLDKDIVNPDVAAAYEDKHPMHRDAVQIYNQHKKQLDSLRKEANEIRVDQSLEIRERQEMLRDNIILQNLIKREMLDQVKDYNPDF